jgi:drug/metabolite transporter (DMT)-like permease
LRFMLEDRKTPTPPVMEGAGGGSTPSAVAPPRTSSVYVKLTFVALFWGGTFIAGRVLAVTVPHMVAAASRFLVASILLLVAAWRLEGGLPRLNARQAVVTALLGATGIFLYNVCFFGALSLLPAGRTALIIALNPAVTALAMSVLLRERLEPARWLGIALALAGTMVIITRGDLSASLSRSFGRGELMMFGGVCAWAAYTIIGQRALRGLTPIAATTYAALWGCSFLLVGAAFEWRDVHWASLGWRAGLSVLYLGALGTVLGFVWYYEGVRAIGPARTAVFINLVPVFGVALAALLLGEPVLLSMLIGGAMVIAGVTLTNRRRRA